VNRVPGNSPRDAGNYRVDRRAAVTGTERLERILAPDYLDGLEDRSTAEIRAMRDACEEEESGISYARRILQGKIDIVRAEALRRREEGQGGARSLLDRLPEILGDRVTARSPQARAVRFLVPPSAQEHARRAEQLGEEVLASVRERPPEELSAMVEELAARERELSGTRHQLFERIDTLQAELTRRYREGGADVREIMPGGR
jgi:hypothetical protein